MCAPCAHSYHNPDCADVFWIRDDLDTKCVATLISPGHNNFFAYWVTVYVRDDTITVTMSELDRERFKNVTFGHIILNSVLEFDCCEISSSDPFEFVVCKGGGK